MIKCVLSAGAETPKRQHSDDAGSDLYCPQSFSLSPLEAREIDLLCKFEIPKKFVGIVCPRSSISRRSIHVYQGIIDSGYRGSVKVRIQNLSQETQHFSTGDRIAQILVIPVCLDSFVAVESLSQTERGEKGFGSTGL